MEEDGTYAEARFSQSFISPLLYIYFLIYFISIPSPGNPVGFPSVFVPFLSFVVEQTFLSMILSHNKTNLVYWIKNPLRRTAVVDVNNLKNGRKPEKLQKESPAGCTGEGKQSKGN